MATYDLASSIPTTESLRAGDIINCSYCGAVKGMVLPKGVYKLEAWGGEGGYFYSPSQPGGKGGYSYGTLTLTADTTLYWTGGQAGATGNYSTPFGGGGASSGGGSIEYSASGGGGSDIRIGTDSLYARVIVAGVGEAYDIGLVVGYPGSDFRPDQTITLQEFYILIDRFSKIIFK